MERTGKPRFSSVAATFETASTYVFAGRLIRKAEVRGSAPSAPPFGFNDLQRRHWVTIFALATTWPLFSR
jgi:hypothetical protein